MPIFVTLFIIIPSPRGLDQSLSSYLICCLWISHWVLLWLIGISIWGFMLMTGERYCAFYHPVKHRVWFSSGSKAKFLILSTWLFSLFSMGLPSITLATVNVKTESCSSNFDSKIVFSLSVFKFVVYVILLPTTTSICLICIFIRLRRLGRKRGVVHGALRRAKYSLLLTILITFIISMAIFAPINVILILYKYFSIFVLDRTFVIFISDWTICLLIAKYLSTSLIYTIANKQFRDKLSGLLCQLKRKHIRKNKVHIIPLGTFNK